MPAVWQHTHLPCRSPLTVPSLAASSRHNLARRVAAQPSQSPPAVPGRRPVLLSKPLPREEPPAADIPGAGVGAEAAQPCAPHHAAVNQADHVAASIVPGAADMAADVASTSDQSQANVEGGSGGDGSSSSSSKHSSGGSTAGMPSPGSTTPAGLLPQTLWLYRPATDDVLSQHTHQSSYVQPAQQSDVQQPVTVSEQGASQHSPNRQQQQQQQQLPCDERQRHKQDVQLRNQLRQMGSWQQWAEFLQQEGSHLSAASIVYAFIRLRELHADRTATAAGPRDKLPQTMQQLQLKQAAEQQTGEPLPTLQALQHLQQHNLADQAVQQQQQDGIQQQQQQQQHHQQQQQQAFDQTWAALVALALAAAPQLAPVQWSQLAYTAAKLNKRDRGLLAAVATHTCGQTTQLKGAGLVNALWAFAALQQGPGEQWLEAHTEAAAAQLPDLNCHQLVTLLWCWGRLGHRPPAAAVQALLSSVSRSFKALSPSELSNTVWALARLGYVPSRTWMRKWFYASRATLSNAAAEGASGSSSGMNTSNTTSSISTTTTSSSSASNSSSSSSSSSENVHLLACMAGSLATLRVAPPRHWHKAWLAAVSAHWGSLSARQLGVVLCALAKQRRPLHPRWLGMVARRFGELLPAASTADIAAVVWALPKLAFPNAMRYGWRLQRTGLLAAVARATEPGLGRATPGQLVQLAGGFAGLKYYPGVHWMKVHENAAAAQHGALTKANRERLRRAYCALWGVQR